MRGIELLDQSVLGGAVVTQASVKRGAFPADGNDLHAAVRRMHFMQEVDALLRKAREEPRIRNAAPGPGYVVSSGTSAVALSGATAKTVIYLNSGSNDEATICEFAVGFDGVTASNVSALIELCLGTKATNSSPGTGSTSFTPIQIRGWAVKTASVAAANACSSEPTVLTPTKQYLVTPNAGLLVIQFPLGREPTSHNIASTSGLQFAIRITAPNAVNTRAYTEHEE